MLPIGANEIIARVHQQDLQLQEEQMKREREARKILRLQAGNVGMTGSELLKKLAGDEDEPKASGLEMPKEKPRNEPKRPATGFPAPPKSASKPRQEG